jgi:hypothetical protein
MTQVPQEVSQTIIKTNTRVRFDLVVGLALIVVMFGAILIHVAGVSAGVFISGAGLLIFCIFSWANLPLMARILLIVSFLAAISSLRYSDAPLLLVRRATQQASLLAGLAAALVFLRDAAFGSAMVQRAGQDLLRLSPARRYAVLTSGAHFFGLVLNFGVINLLGPAVCRATSNNDSNVLRDRLLMAVLNGFSSTCLWSPLSVAPIMALSSMPTLSWGRFAPFGFAGACGMLALGTLLDHSGSESSSEQVIPPAAKWWLGILQLAAFIMLIVGSIFAIRKLLAIGTVVAIILTVPVISTLWIAIQERSNPAPLKALLNRLFTFVQTGLPAAAVEAVFLSAATFIGTIMADEIDRQGLSTLMGLSGIPVCLLPPLVFCIIVFLPLIGVAPLLSVIVFSAIIGNPVTVGLSPLVMALAYVAAFGVSTGLSPVAATTTIIGRLAEASPIHVGFVLNRKFTLIAILGWILVLTVMAYLISPH